MHTVTEILKNILAIKSFNKIYENKSKDFSLVCQVDITDMLILSSKFYLNWPGEAS